MDVIFIAASYGAAYAFLRTHCEATIGQACFALVLGFTITVMVFI